MIIFTFLGKVLVGFSYHYINILSSILYSIIMINSGGGEGPGEGPSRGPASPPLFLHQSEAWRAQKNFFKTGPPLSQSLDDRPPSYLKVWICHWL